MHHDPLAHTSDHTSDHKERPYSREQNRKYQTAKRRFPEGTIREKQMKGSPYHHKSHKRMSCGTRDINRANQCRLIIEMWVNNLPECVAPVWQIDDRRGTHFLEGTIEPNPGVAVFIQTLLPLFSQTELLPLGTRPNLIKISEREMEMENFILRHYSFPRSIKISGETPHISANSR